MKKREVVLKQLYRAEVRGKVTIVRVTREDPKGGWQALDIASRRPVRIAAAKQLLTPCDRNGKAIEFKPPAKAPAKKAAEKAPAKPKAAAKKAAKPKVAAKPKAPAKKAAKPKATAKYRSGLDAAVAVLAERGHPMKPREIVPLAFHRGLWSSQGKTPDATIGAAIIREIAAKGDQSRFTKTAPGTFALTNVGELTDIARAAAKRK